MKSLSTLVESEIRPLSSGEVLHLDIDKLSMEDRLQAYAIVQWMLEKLKGRRESLNERLKEDTRQVGATNDKGHVRFSHSGTVSTVEKRVAKTPDEKELNKLLTANKIDVDSVYDTVQAQQLNLSKVNKLVELGKLKQADVDGLFKVTFALTVDPSEALTKLLDEAAQHFEVEKAVVASEPKPLLESSKKNKK